MATQYLFFLSFSLVGAAFIHRSVYAYTIYRSPEIILGVVEQVTSEVAAAAVYTFRVKECGGMGIGVFGCGRGCRENGKFGLEGTTGGGREESDRRGWIIYVTTRAREIKRHGENWQGTHHGCRVAVKGLGSGARCYSGGRTAGRTRNTTTRAPNGLSFLRE